MIELRTGRASTVEWLDRNASPSSHDVESIDAAATLVMIRDTKFFLADTSVAMLENIEVDQLVELTLKMGTTQAQALNLH